MSAQGFSSLGEFVRYAKTRMSDTVYAVERVHSGLTEQLRSGPCACGKMRECRERVKTLEPVTIEHGYDYDFGSVVRGSVPTQCSVCQHEQKLSVLVVVSPTT